MGHANKNLNVFLPTSIQMDEATTHACIDIIRTKSQYTWFYVLFRYLVLVEINAYMKIEYTSRINL